MARKRKYRLYRNEVVINLLPEKAKRDYILRLVSFIIVLIFVIINFFTLFIPNMNRLNRMNELKRVYVKLEAEFNNLQSYFNEFYHNKLYDVSKNADRQKIEDSQLDLESTIDDIKEILSMFDDSEFIYLESVNYNSEDNTLFIQVQFYDSNHIVNEYGTDFITKLSNLKYVSDIDFERELLLPEFGEPRAQVRVTITLDPESMPKVGDEYDA